MMAARRGSWTMARAAVLAACVLTAGEAAAEPPLAGYPTTEHPVQDYAQAMELFNAGQQETAACLFYRGQYRFRVRLAAHPELNPTGEPALFASLSDMVGRPINEWVGGDPKDWASAIECALDWVAANDDPLTPKAENAEAHRSVEAGLRELLDMVRTDGDKIRAERAANGLPNR